MNGLLSRSQFDAVAETAKAVTSCAQPQSLINISHSNVYYTLVTFVPSELKLQLVTKVTCGMDVCNFAEDLIT